MKIYSCYNCGKEHVKLWRPFNDVEPLLCATCLENRQCIVETEEYDCKKDVNGDFIASHTGKMISLPYWRIDEDGLIPKYFGPIITSVKTDQLIVNLSDITPRYPSGETTMIPAVPIDGKEISEMSGYTSSTPEVVQWWKNLPTRCQ